MHGQNAVWCKSRPYCSHISRKLVKTTVRILAQQIRQEENMIPYYVAGLLGKYTAVDWLSVSIHSRGICTLQIQSSPGGSLSAGDLAFDRSCLETRPKLTRPEAAPPTQPVYPEPAAPRQLLPSGPGVACTSRPDKQHRMQPG